MPMKFLIDIKYSFCRLWAILRPHRIRWKFLHIDAKFPIRAYPTDGGFDIFSVEDLHIGVGAHVNVGTGLAVQIGKGWSYDLRGRSGLNKKGIIAALGLVDAEYCGELRIVLSNLSGEEYTINKGERIGQLKFNPVFDFQWEQVEDFPHRPGTRGANGWGSSGK
jgi:dUTP pyrophosphatase